MKRLTIDGDTLPDAATVYRRGDRLIGVDSEDRPVFELRGVNPAATIVVTDADTGQPTQLDADPADQLDDAIAAAGSLADLKAALTGNVRHRRAR